MIPAAIELPNAVSIPVWDSTQRCIIEWGEEDCAEDVLKRASDHPFYSVYDRIFTPIEEEYERRFSLITYEVTCIQTKTKYYMVSTFEIEEFDDILHCVCVPFNKINLMILYGKLLCPLHGKKFED